MIKNVIEELIDIEIPFINKFDSILNEDWRNNDFVSNKLIPYFFFKNTINPKGKIIISCFSKKEYVYLIPFYYFTGIFKEVAENLLQKHNFQDYVIKDKIVFTYESNSTHYAKNVSFTSREIRVQKPSGGIGSIDFNQFTSSLIYFKNLTNRKYLDLYQKIDKFNKIFNASEDPFDILNQKEFFSNINRGAIFLTRKTEAIKYLKVNIHGEKFQQKVPIGTISIKRGELQVDPLSKHKNIKNKKELMVIGSLEFLEGIHEIINKKPWLSTIIIDLTEENENRIKEVNDFVNQDLKKLLQATRIKNIHILFRDYQFNQFEKFEVIDLPKSYFFINQQQRTFFSNIAQGSINIETLKTNEVNTYFKAIIQKTKNILDRIHFNDKILNFLYQVNKISLRMISYFDPLNLNDSIKKLIDQLEIIESSIANTNLKPSFTSIKSNLVSLKELYLPIYQERIDFLNRIHEESIYILAYNDNDLDKENLKFTLPYKKILFYNCRQFDTVFSKAKSSDAVVIFNLNNNLIKAITNRILPFDLYLFLSSHDSTWHHNESVRFLNRSKQFSNTKNLCDAIQVEYKTEYEQPNTSEIEEFIPIDKDSKEFSDIFDFRIIAQNIISRSNSIIGGYSKNRETVEIIYEDGTYENVFRGSSFYIFKEGDIRSLSEIRVKAEELVPGNIVFKFKGHHSDFDQVLFEYAKSEPELARYLNEDKIWRKNISDFMVQRSLTYEDLRLRFKKFGYQFESPGNIHNWTESLVMVPDKFEKLLQAMCNMKIINEDEVTTFLNSTKIVKTIKTKLPKELYRLHVAQENNIPFSGDPELARLVNQIYHLVEIKEVLTLI